jgi:hypothetical protein
MNQIQISNLTSQDSIKLEVRNAKNLKLVAVQDLELKR